jgi:hypothetical protein
MTLPRLAALLALLLLTGCTASPPMPSEPPSPSGSSTPVSMRPTTGPAPSGSAPAESPTLSPLDTADWTSYVSERYGFRIGHPADWTVVPATRSWTMEEDAGAMETPGQDGFLSAEGDLWLTAWAAPYTAGETLHGVQRFAEQYCGESLNTECATIGDRAVRLCNEMRDCHPGLLVPFEFDTIAFFTGGMHGQQMTVVAVWRAPDFPARGYGTAREILDAFLSTMDVWPQP